MESDDDNDARGVEPTVRAMTATGLLYAVILIALILLLFGSP